MTGLLEVGRVVKPHGIRGEVIVELVTDRTERLDAGSVLSSSAGDLTVVRSSPHQGRFIVAFAGVDDRTAAEGLRGVVLSAPPIEDADALWVHELLDSEVVTPDGVIRGRVVSVLDNPAAAILELDRGDLVPVTFVVSREPGRVVVDVPAGLFADDE